MGDEKASARSCAQSCAKFGEDKTKLTTLVVFCCDVLILVIVLIILWVMPEPRTPGEECGYMCLPAYENGNIDCGCRAKLLSAYLEKSFKKSYGEVTDEYTKVYNTRISKIYGGYIGDVKPVAHMIGEKREPSSEKNKPVTKWYKGNNCLLLNGMSMHNGRLRVPVNGYYYVYSMLDVSYHYQINAGNDIKVITDMPTLVHSIVKSNFKDGMVSSMPIISTCHPYEISRNRIFGRFDTYIGSDVYLKAGDEVSVKVSNISYVNSPPKNVFGIYMI